MKDSNTDVFAGWAAAAHLVQPEIGAIAEVVGCLRSCKRVGGDGHIHSRITIELAGVPHGGSDPLRVDWKEVRPDRRLTSARTRHYIV